MTHPIGSGVGDYVARLINFTSIYPARKKFKLLEHFQCMCPSLHAITYMACTLLQTHWVSVLALFDNEKDHEQSNQQHQSLFISHTNTYTILFKNSKYLPIINTEQQSLAITTIQIKINTSTIILFQCHTCWQMFLYW